MFLWLDFVNICRGNVFLWFCRLWCFFVILVLRILHTEFNLMFRMPSILQAPLLLNHDTIFSLGRRNHFHIWFGSTIGHLAFLIKWPEFAFELFLLRKFFGRSCGTHFFWRWQGILFGVAKLRLHLGQCLLNLVVFLDSQSMIYVDSWN